METMTSRCSSIADRAAVLFGQGYNCAETMVLALAPAERPIPEDVQRAATAFGGGIARAGLTCGCVTGAAIAAGLRLGRTSPDDADAKERAYRAMANVVRRFEAEFGTTECRKLTGLDFNEENPRAQLDRVHAEVCARLVRFTAGVAAEEIAAAESGRV